MWWGFKNIYGTPFSGVITHIHNFKTNLIKLMLSFKLHCKELEYQNFRDHINHFGLKAVQR